MQNNKGLGTLKEENFAGRKFRGFMVFWPTRESLFSEFFRPEASAEVCSREIRESRVIYDVDSKNGSKYHKITNKAPYYL